jgi:hypothetical protein
MELDRETRSAISLAAEIEILSYTCPASQPREVIARIDLGSVANPLSGVGGSYSARAYINTVRVQPDTTIALPAGQTRALVISRPLPLDPADVLSLRLLGLVSDTSVDTVASLRNATPVQASDVGGDGSVSVTADYGSSGALSYRTSGNVAVDNATIRAYLAADHAAGRTAQLYVKGQSYTAADGSWTRPILLDPGSYVLVFAKQGLYGPDTVSVTVS